MDTQQKNDIGQKNTKKCVDADVHILLTLWYIYANTNTELSKWCSVRKLSVLDMGQFNFVKQ